MDNETQSSTENGSPRHTPEIEDLSSDKDTTGNRRDESQILADQDMTNEHDISALDENMGAISHSMDSLEDEPDEFLQGDVDVVTQMRRTSRAMSDAIDESSGRRAHVKHDTYKNQ
jgi:hypothetical protein